MTKIKRLEAIVFLLVGLGILALFCSASLFAWSFFIAATVVMLVLFTLVGMGYLMLTTVAAAMYGVITYLF